MKNIGFISTRFAGTDGVSLESNKWADIFKQNGHKCFWFGGEISRESESSFLANEAHFKHDLNEWINSRIIGRTSRADEVTEAIHNLRTLLKKKIYAFLERFQIDLIVAQNVLTIPMHVPLGLALTEVIAETQIPTIAHHHDFYWERVRFAINGVADYIAMAFPPKLASINHVVINSEAQEQLALRTGISSVIVPNVIDFDHPHQKEPIKAKDFRESIGINEHDKIILQPTRIVQRKGIEQSINLVKELNRKNIKLVISHEAGDEGYEYGDWLTEYAKSQSVDLKIVPTQIGDPWQHDKESTMVYSLWDIYPFADFITYPSLYEGFGNAFLEAVYFKKPILINRYATFVRDIEPLGFELAVMDGYLSRKTIELVNEILNSQEIRQQMVEHNYRIAAKHYSYGVLRQQLRSLMIKFFGNSLSLEL